MKISSFVIASLAVSVAPLFAAAGKKKAYHGMKHHEPKFSKAPVVQYHKAPVIKDKTPAPVLPSLPATNAQQSCVNVPFSNPSECAEFHQVSSPYQCVHDTSKTLCSATRQEFDDTCYSVAPTPQSYECYQLQANEVCWDEPKSVPQNCESPTRPSVPVA
eukprot:GHVT01088361.1.p1 GENE.GHVT01088361.1~~GHVT01088361.1.p1  ORF type:complete len:160 (-),score=24.26 GHVT01088361.1:15-494(-)